MTNKEIEYIQGLLGSESIIPLKLETKRRFLTLLALDVAMNYGKTPSEEHEGLVGVDAVIIRYENRGENRRIAFASVDKVDIEGITEKYVNFYSRRYGHPVHAYREAPQVVLIDKDSAKYLEYMEQEVRNL